MSAISCTTLQANREMKKNNIESEQEERERNILKTRNTFFLKEIKT
jgi:hypothetical protein